MNLFIIGKLKWTTDDNLHVRETELDYLESPVNRGTQREILRKRAKNNNKAWIKFSETILSILGDCWKKNYLFLTPSKTDGRVPSQQPYNLQPDLLGSFIGHNSDLEW